jgi:peptidoglycan/LPS O-acetylase OafA/YrhL
MFRLRQVQIRGEDANQWGYRPALTGIRALAVYIVILFHSDIPMFSSGYIGVDLFFVLSGFLVCNVLVDEYEKNGKLTLPKFYARRMRRLLPAMGAMVLSVSLFYVLLQNTAERIKFIPSARSAFLYFANWNFIIESADYFSPEAKTNPFGHLWSLAIEEQFYLFFPIFLALTYKIAKRFGKRLLIAIPLCLLFASLFLQVLLNSNVARSYYGTDTKIYQLLAGATLAIWLRDRKVVFKISSRFINGLGILASFGFVLLATRFSAQLSASQTGIIATVLGVLMIFSIENQRNGALSRLFSFRPFVYLGNISYATYLWHWPIIIVLRQLFDIGPIVLTVCTIGLSTIFASASSHMLEMPIRTSKFSKRNSLKSISVGVVFSVLFGLLLIPKILNTENDAMTKIRMVPIANSKSDSSSSQNDAAISDFLDEPKQWFPQPNCINMDLSLCYLHKGSGKTVLLIGDSHAIRIAEMFVDAAKRLDFSLLISSAGRCPWPIGLRLPTITNEERLKLCSDIERENLQRVIPEVKPALIILTNRTFDSAFRIESLGKRGLEAVNQLASGTIDLYASDGRNVLIVEPIPETNDFDSRVCVLDASTSEARQLCAFEISMEPTDFELFERELDVKRSNVATINIDDWVCPRAPICDPTGNGAIVWADDNHIAPGYARTLGLRMADFLKATQFLEAGGQG